MLEKKDAAILRDCISSVRRIWHVPAKTLAAQWEVGDESKDAEILLDYEYDEGIIGVRPHIRPKELTFKVCHETLHFLFLPYHRFVDSWCGKGGTARPDDEARPAPSDTETERFYRMHKTHFEAAANRMTEGMVTLLNENRRLRLKLAEKESKRKGAA